MTTGSRPAPYRIPITFQEKTGLVLLDRIRALDKTRLIKKMGETTTVTLSTTLHTLQELFAE